MNINIQFVSCNFRYWETISVALSDDSIQVFGYQPVYTSLPTTSDCDVIVNIHELSLRNGQPIWCDVASVKLNELIITLVVQMGVSIEHDTIEWEYIKISWYMKRERAVETEFVYRTICLLRTLIETVILRYYISYDTVELLISTLH